MFEELASEAVKMLLFIFWTTLAFAVIWGAIWLCRGWDLNPRTPTGQAPEACAFDQARQPLLAIKGFS
jgi:hypothetical protein